jgi:hypothetical protein
LSKVIVTFEDVLNPENPGQVAVRFKVSADRSGDDVNGLDKFPATPSMLFGMTIARMFEAGAIDTMIGFVCRDIMNSSNLSSEEQAHVKAQVDKALGQS